MTWTTRVPYSETYGVKELHQAFFAPAEWRPNRDPLLNLSLPECELTTIITKGRPVPVAYRQSAQNPSFKRGIATLVAAAKQYHPAHIIISCDTEPDLAKAVKAIQPRLPNHKRIALERALNGQSYASNS